MKTKVVSEKSSTKAVKTKELSGILSERDRALKEAMRYYANANEDLKKAGKEDGYYNDKKYVKRAGHTLWTGIILMLDEFYKAQNIQLLVKKGQRPDQRDYKEPLAKRNQKAVKLFETGYETCHLHMGYDGTLNVKTVSGAKETFTDLINWLYENWSEKN